MDTGIEDNVNDTLIQGCIGLPPPYVYSKLEDPQRDIRLVTIIRGRRNDRIRLRIRHTRLRSSPDTQPEKRWSLKDWEKSLPSSGWVVRETIEGRFIFLKRQHENAQWQPTWDSWDPNLDRVARASLEVEDTLGRTSVNFNALSYVWGDVTTANQRTLLIEGESSTWSNVTVGHNLAIALQHLRDEHEDRNHWIDSLSIDQSNLSERSEQVARIADIYSVASRVTVWLGEESEDSSMALSAIKRVSSNVELLKAGYFFLSPDADLSWADLDRPLPLSHAECDSIQALLGRELFSRLWIVQEVTLGGPRAIVQCGSAEVSWSRFCQVILFMNETFGQQSGVAFQLCARILKRHSIISTIQMTARRECSVAHDRVYGILSLMPEGLKRLVKPDYTKDLGDVYKEFMLANVAHFKRFELFGYSRLSTREPKWPSWVFRLTIGTGEPKDSQRLVLRKQFAAHFTTSEVELSAPSTLKATGIKVATLSQVSEPAQTESADYDNAHWAACLKEVRSWEPNDMFSAEYVTGESLLVAYSTTLRANQFRDRYPQINFWPTVTEWTSQASVNALFGPKAKENKMDMSILSDAERDALGIVSGRCFISSNEGYIGLGPNGSKVGTYSGLQGARWGLI